MQGPDVNPHCSSTPREPDKPVSPFADVFVLNVDHATKQTVSALLFFLLALLLVYAPSFSGVWIYDDEPNILSNANIHLEKISNASLKKAFFLQSQDPDAAERVKRPLAYLSFALNWYFGKDRVFGYHVVNFMIHFIATAFLYLFIKNSMMLPVFGNRYHDLAHPAAFLSAILWAVHPIQVTAVTYIVQRMASMAGMFTIMSMYGYLKARTARNRASMTGCFAACGLFALCALATKENSAMLPVSLFFYEFLVIRGAARADSREMMRWGVPALGIVLVAGLLYTNPASLLDGYGHRPYTIVERMMTEPRVVLVYLKMLFYPLLSQLTLVHDVDVSTSLWSPWTTLPSIILVAILFFVSWFRVSRRHPLAAFAIIFFFVNHAIEGSFIGLELIYEHRNYIPSMMLFLIPVILFLNALKYFSYNRKIRMLFVISGALIIASIGHSTYAYSHLFRHGLIFWRDNAGKSPCLSVVLNNYGIELMKHGYSDDAFQKLQRAVALDRYFNFSQKGVVYHNLGLYYETIENDYERALTYFKKAIGITSNCKKMWFALSLCHMANEDPETASERIRDALERWPDNPDFLTLMARAQLLTGNLDAACDYARQARAVSTGAVGPLAIFGEIYRLQGERNKALFFWQAYYGQRPDSVAAALVLSGLYHENGNWDRLGRVVSDLLAAKGARAWDAWLQESLKREMLYGAVMVAPDPETILSVISYSLQRESEKTVKER